MGMIQVEVDGQRFRYYDNGGSVHAPDGTIIGTLDEARLDVYRYDGDAERARSEDVIMGHLRAMVISWLRRVSPVSPRPDVA